MKMIIQGYHLIKSIETIADDNSDDPFLIGLKERAEIVEKIMRIAK
jgi:hypothetical protein